MFLIHSLIGLKLNLFILFVCLTGTLAVVSHELEWVFLSKVRSSDTRRVVTWGTQLAAAKAAFPAYQITYASAGEEPYLASIFEAIDPAGRLRFIYVDPATGRVNGESGFITFSSIMRAVHYYLFTPGDWGFYVVTALGFVLVASLVSGVAVHRRFPRGLFRIPRTNRGVRVFWGDLHRLIGLWSSWFILVIAITGIWYFVERTLENANVPLETARERVSTERIAALGRELPEPLPLDELVTLATSRVPQLEVKHIWFPESPEEPVFIRGQATAWLVRDPANGVELNPYTGEVLAVHRAEEMSLVERWMHTADPLHFGDFGGVWSKIVWFVFGLLMCCLPASGAVIYGKRTLKAGRTTASSFSG